MRLVPIGLLVALTVRAKAAFATHPRLGGGGSVDISLGRIVLSLLLCLIAAALLALMLKRSDGRIDLSAIRGLLKRQVPERRIEIVESRRAGQHSDVTLIRCDGFDYLVLSSERQLLLLRESGVIGDRS